MFGLALSMTLSSLQDNLNHAHLEDMSPIGLEYCAVVRELHEVLDDPSADVEISGIGASSIETEFADIWLSFDERLRSSAPNSELLSALETVGAYSRNVVDPDDVSPPSDDEYLHALAQVLDYHTDVCLDPPDENEQS